MGLPEEKDDIAMVMEVMVMATAMAMGTATATATATVMKVKDEINNTIINLNQNLLWWELWDNYIDI